MKKLMLLLGSASVGFAHLHTGSSSTIVDDLIHIVSQPDHILIVAAMALGVFGYRKFVKVKVKG